MWPSDTRRGLQAHWTLNGLLKVLWDEEPLSWQNR